MTHNMCRRTRWEFFDDANLQKPYEHTQGKYDETVIIASRSRNIGTKLKARKNTAPLPGFNKALDEHPFIKSGLTQ